MDIRELKKEPIILNPSKFARYVAKRHGLTLLDVCEIDHKDAHSIYVRRLIMWAVYCYSYLSIANIGNLLDIPRTTLVVDSNRTKDLPQDKNFRNEMMKMIEEAAC